MSPGPHRDVPSFPTRRSSDLIAVRLVDQTPDGFARLSLAAVAGEAGVAVPSLYKHVESLADLKRGVARIAVREDRKSTRLNSSHANISYAVFCLKKKKKRNER